MIVRILSARCTAIQKASPEIEKWPFFLCIRSKFLNSEITSYKCASNSGKRLQRAEQKVPMRIWPREVRVAEVDLFKLPKEGRGAYKEGMWMVCSWSHFAGNDVGRAVVRKYQLVRNHDFWLQVAISINCIWLIHIHNDCGQIPSMVRGAAF
jgi:hypothetical protein